MSPAVSAANFGFLIVSIVRSGGVTHSVDGMPHQSSAATADLAKLHSSRHLVNQVAVHVLRVY